MRISQQKLNENLMKAITQGDVSLARTLIENKANVDSKDALGLTCLHQANISRNPALIKLLLEKKANPTIKAKIYDGVLYAPVLHAGHLDPPNWNCVEAYPDMHFDKDDKAQYGGALNIAASKKEFSVVKKLLLSGAAAHWATSELKQNTLHFLIQALFESLQAKDAISADLISELIVLTLKAPRAYLLQLTDSNGQTAFELAVSLERPECIDILIQPNAYQDPYQQLYVIDTTLKLPNDLTYLIFQYVRVCVDRSRFESAIYIANVHAFCQAYQKASKTVWGRSSENSKKLVSDLNQTLISDQLLTKPTQEGERILKTRIADFFKLKVQLKGTKPTRATDLLSDFNLTPSDEKPQPFKSYEDYVKNLTGLFVRQGTEMHQRPIGLMAIYLYDPIETTMRR